MLQKTCDHSTVSIRNKMFVIARYDTNKSEVFDSIIFMFTFMETIAILDVWMILVA